MTGCSLYTGDTGYAGYIGREISITAASVRQWIDTNTNVAVGGTIPFSCIDFNASSETLNINISENSITIINPSIYCILYQVTTRTTNTASMSVAVAINGSSEISEGTINNIPGDIISGSQVYQLQTNDVITLINKSSNTLQIPAVSIDGNRNPTIRLTVFRTF